jgi:hypothetical protein
MVTAAKALPTDRAFLCIQGSTVYFDDILNDALLRRGAELRRKFLTAEPFPHIVLDDLFSPDLLQLVWDSYAEVAPRVMKARRSERETTFRSRIDTEMPAPVQTYFDAVNSGRFVKFLAELTGVAGLVTDPFLQRGGLHESRDGGKFNLHVDFNKHPVTHLDNRLVLITYLNRDWREEFGGVLELWAGPQGGCAAKVIPEFGRSIIMLHSETSWHVHPTAIVTPDNRPGRSLASYYYSNGRDDRATEARFKTQFMPEPDETALGRVIKAVKYVTPPILVDAGRLVKHAAFGKKP